MHDEKGNLAPPRELIRLPIIFIEAALRRSTGRRPTRPLLPHSVTKWLKDILNPNSFVIEFGSGASTVWLAQRVGKLWSYETDPIWFDRITQNLSQKNITNTSLRSWEGDMPEMPDLTPDLIIIDGHRRDICSEYATQAAGSKTRIILDNSDKDVFPFDPELEMRCSEKNLIEFAKKTDRLVEYKTGFAPAQLYAEQSMLVGIGSSSNLFCPVAL